MGNVLIVDDEPAIGAYLANVIASFGHKSVTTLNATDTLAQLDSGDFHLIIADIRLPDVTDPQTWISQLCEKAKGIPIVLISGDTSNELTESATANGVLAFLSKPFELAFIKNILKNVFNS